MVFRHNVLKACRTQSLSDFKVELDNLKSLAQEVGRVGSLAVFFFGLPSFPELLHPKRTTALTRVSKVLWQ